MNIEVGKCYEIYSVMTSKFFDKVRVEGIEEDWCICSSLIDNDYFKHNMRSPYFDFKEVEE